MRYLKRRISTPVQYSAMAEKGRILKTGRVKRCGTCTLDIPEDDIIVEDGAERCPMCQDTMTSEWKARELEDVTRIKAEAFRKLFDPPQFSVRKLQEVIPGAVTSIQRSITNPRGAAAFGVTVSQTNPLMMTRNVPIALYLAGTKFSSADVITYPAGITDSSAIARMSVLTTLTLVASLAMAPGTYGLTFNSNVYHNILNVR